MNKPTKKARAVKKVGKSRPDREEIFGLFYCKVCKDVVPQKRSDRTYMCNEGHPNKENVREIMDDMNSIAARMKELKEGKC